MCAYQQLLVWRRAQALAAQVYHATHELPTADHFDLASRLRAAAIAVPVEIATHDCCDGPTFLLGLKRARDALIRFEHFAAIANRTGYWPSAHARYIARHTTLARKHLRALVHVLTPSSVANQINNAGSSPGVFTHGTSPRESLESDITSFG